MPLLILFFSPSARPPSGTRIPALSYPWCSWRGRQTQGRRPSLLGGAGEGKEREGGMEKKKAKEKVDSVISQLDLLSLFFFTSLVSLRLRAPRLSVDLAAPVWSSLRVDDICRASRKKRNERKRRRKRESRFRTPTFFFFRFRQRRRPRPRLGRRKRKKKCPRSFGSPRWTRCDAEQE